MGQIVNRQPVKGGLMVGGVSLLFVATLGLTFYKVSRAIMAMGELDPTIDKWAALNVQLMAQGMVWLLAMLALYLVVLVWSVIDAWRRGQALDRQERGAKTDALAVDR
jgi:Zn-dependent protease with chaperone function